MLAACFIGSQAKAQQEANPMLANAQTVIDVPYVAHTLETDGEEELVINCDEVDCTTCPVSSFGIGKQDERK